MCSRISFSDSAWNAAPHPGTSSPHLNSFMSGSSVVVQGTVPMCALASTIRSGRLARKWAFGTKAADTIARVCRVLAYLGEPISLQHVLYETDSCLVRQSYSPRMMETFLNLAGFG